MTLPDVVRLCGEVSLAYSLLSRGGCPSLAIAAAAAASRVSEPAPDDPLAFVSQYLQWRYPVLSEYFAPASVDRSQLHNAIDRILGDEP